MKNLKPPRQTIVWYERIMDSKRGVVLINLKSLHPRIKDYYKKYSEKVKNKKFDKISPFTFNTAEQQALKHCYDSPTNDLNLLKKTILDIHTKVVGYTCQYCSTSIPNTFDHYYPKELFPEYSVLSINLIPACSRCNQNKGDEFDPSDRQIINLYFENLTSTQYLFCKITYSDDIPEVEFYIKKNGISKNKFKIINAHFNKLKLAELYKLKANDVITETTISLKSYCKNKNIKVTANELLSEADRLKKIHGTNYWKAILKEGLSKNSTYLNSTKN